MLGLDWNNLMVADMLGFGVLILMTLMLVSLAIWFACSAMAHLTKMGRRIRRSNHNALLRENERLRNSLTDARQENDYLRKLYRDPPPLAEDRTRNVVWQLQATEEELLEFRSAG
jgi:5-bromo-4-chloroindolyl phosphate hydrolysis protein